MKITDIRADILFGRSIFVRVFTDEGLVGLGECSPMNARILAHFVETGLKPLLIGQDPLDIDRLWTLMFYRTYKLGVQGIQPEAISGVDIALWDILGKKTGMPLWKLFGGAYRDRVTAYKSIGGGADMTPRQMVEKVEQALREGFRAVKIRMDWGPTRPDANPDKDLEMFRLCKSLTGDTIPLSFDANNGYSLNTAISQGRRFEKLGIYHFEEPLAQYDYAGLARLSNTLDVPIAAGEHEYTRWQFRDLILQAQVAILQPDVLKCAGLTEMRRIATLSETFSRHFVPHQTQPTVGTTANLHLVASLVSATRPQEYTGQNARLDSLFVEPLRFENGELTLPNSPGLGLELDQKRFDEALQSGS